MEALLSLTQSSSALVFTTFAVVHLTAPLTAVYGGEEFASLTMLLGREWYQGGKKELIVVWGSLGVHLLSGVLKRISKTARVYRLRQGRHLSAKQETIESKQVDAKLHKSLSYTPSLQARTGYLLVPIVAIHSLTHRVWPASSKAPYKGLSPSLLSYNFVSYSLQNYTISSIVGYGSLILLATYHFTSGVRSILAGGPRRKKARLQTAPWQIGWVGFAAALSVGVYRLRGGYVSRMLGKRYAAVLQDMYHY